MGLDRWRAWFLFPVFVAKKPLTSLWTLIWNNYASKTKHSYTRWWFQRLFIFTPSWGKMIQFDKYVSKGLEATNQIARPKLPKVGPSWSLRIDEKRSQKAEEIGSFCLNVIFLGDILLMVQKSGIHQLRLVVYPIFYRVFIHPRWLVGFQPSTVSLHFFWELSLVLFVMLGKYPCFIGEISPKSLWF